MTEPYRPRRIEPLGVVERDGWTIKLTGITAGADLPDDAEVAAAVAAAERELPPGGGIGFCVVHRGTEALWVLVCWWELGTCTSGSGRSATSAIVARLVVVSGGCVRRRSLSRPGSPVSGRGRPVPPG